MKADRAARYLVWSVVLAAAGCSEPEAIRVLEEPNSPPSSLRVIPADQKQYRTLVAMVPAGGAVQDDEPHWWFFKMSGKSDTISRFEADFHTLIESVRTNPEGEPVTWKLPNGWTREKGGSMRYATLKSPDGQAEVSVSQAGGMLFLNVQRWWTQLWGKDKAAEVTAANVFDFAKQRMINGRIVFTVDMSGPKDPNMGGPMMMNPHGGQ